MIIKGIIIFEHVVWEPVNLSLGLSFVLNKPQLDGGLVLWNRDEESEPHLCLYITAGTWAGAGITSWSAA